MQTGSYINGKWYHPASTEISRNINPADTADVIAEFPLADAADVRSAVDAAMEAVPRPGRRRRGPSAAACCGAPPTLPAAASMRSPRR